MLLDSNPLLSADNLKDVAGAIGCGAESELKGSEPNGTYLSLLFL